MARADAPACAFTPRVRQGFLFGIWADGNIIASRAGLPLAHVEGDLRETPALAAWRTAQAGTPSGQPGGHRTVVDAEDDNSMNGNLSHAPRCWILNSNAGRGSCGIDIRRNCVQPGKCEVWPIKPYWKKVAKGDWRFIWAGGLDDEESGIYGLGQIKTDVFPAGTGAYPEYRHDYDGYRFEYKRSGWEAVVEYRYLGRPHISRTEFGNDPDLKPHLIMRFFQRTVYALDEAHKNALGRMVAQRNVPWPPV